MSSPDTILLNTRTDLASLESIVGDSNAGLVKRANDLEAAGGNVRYLVEPGSVDLATRLVPGGIFLSAYTNGPTLETDEELSITNYMLEVTSTSDTGERKVLQVLTGFNINGYRTEWRKSYQVDGAGAISASSDWERVLRQASAVGDLNSFAEVRPEWGSIIAYTTTDNNQRTGYLFQNFSADTRVYIPAFSLRVDWRYSTSNVREYRLVLVSSDTFDVAMSSLNIGNPTSTGSGSHTAGSNELSSMVKDQNELTLFDWMDYRKAAHGAVTVFEYWSGHQGTSVTIELTTYIIDSNRTAIFANVVGEASSTTDLIT